MATNTSINISTILRGVLGAVSVLALAAAPPATAQNGSDREKIEREIVSFDIPAQALDQALVQFSRQSKIPVIASTNMTRGQTSAAVFGDFQPVEALNAILKNTDLEAQRRDGGAYGLVRRVVQVEEIGGAALDDDEPFELEEIVVTGSNIRGIGFGASSGFVLDRNDIQQSGFSGVEYLIESLPQNFGGGASLDTNGGVLPNNNRDAGLNETRGTSVNLRGLGADATLVLLNGKRLAPAGLSIFVDVSAVPISAIERVEVLTDGASAVYGSDAIAGVVNFVLRDDYDGAETLLRYGTVAEGGLQEHKIAQTIGKTWDSGSIIGVYEYLEQDNLPASDRDFVVAAGAPPEFDILPKFDRHNGIVSISQDLSESVSIFGEGLYSNRRGVSIQENFGLESRNFESEQFNFSAGGSAAFREDWQLDFYGSYGEEHSGQETFKLVGGAETVTDRRNSLWSLDAKLDGGLFDIAGGRVKLAAGIGYREQDFVSTVRDRTFELTRDVFAAYGEIFVPLFSSENNIFGLDRLELSTAVRLEKYSDFGSSTDPKVGLLWSFHDSMVIRGTYSTSFKAPTPFDLNPANLNAFLANVPDGSGGTTLLFGLAGASDGTLDAEESTTWTVGFDFEPDFIPGFRLSGTYYDIEFGNRVEPPAPSVFGTVLEPEMFAAILTFDPTQEQIAEALSVAPNFFNVTEFIGPFAVPEDAEVFVDGSIQNIAITETSGLEFSASYAHETAIGDFVFGVSGNYIFELKNALTPTSPFVDVADTAFNPADLRLRANASWYRHGLSGSVFINHTDSYQNNTVDPQAKIDAWTTVDARLSFDTEDRLESQMLKQLRFSVSVQNLLNEEPPSVETSSPFVSVGYDAANANAIGRFIAFELSKEF